MRRTFIKELLKMAQKDKNIWFLIADVGFGIFEDFQKKFPDRFINVGVAEQNMVNIAGGLAMCGKTVFIYTMSTFATMRPYDQLRHIIAKRKLKVRIIGVGGRNDYPTLGFSHNCPNDEDMALMSLLPNTYVFQPKNKQSLIDYMKLSKKFNCPIYIRLPR